MPADFLLTVWAGIFIQSLRVAQALGGEINNSERSRGSE